MNIAGRLKSKIYRKDLDAISNSRILQFIRKLRLKMKGVTIGKDVYIGRRVVVVGYPKGLTIKDGATIKDNVYLYPTNERARITIGCDTRIGMYSFIVAIEGVSIGDHCSFAPFVYVVDSNHSIRKGELFQKQLSIVNPVSIGSDVWIAAGAKVLSGVTIKDGAVVAANAVVSKDVDENSIVGGVPAKHLKYRE